MVTRINKWIPLFKHTAEEFWSDNVIKLSASLAYYTVFSIGPLLLVVMSLTGLFFKQETITGRIHGQIALLIGETGAQQVLTIIQNMQHANNAARFSI